jgi:hypothetical protein
MNTQLDELSTTFHGELQRTYAVEEIRGKASTKDDDQSSF